MKVELGGGMDAAQRVTIWQRRHVLISRIHLLFFLDGSNLHLDTITALYHRKPGGLNPLAIAIRVQAFLLEVIQCAGTAKAGTIGRMQPVLDYIAAHPEEPMPVSDLAARAGLSVPRFNVRFKRETGMPPGEYVLRAKIEEARRRLAGTKMTITGIAFDLGFSSSQYFATAFKRLTRQTPAAYRSLRGTLR